MKPPIRPSSFLALFSVLFFLTACQAASPALPLSGQTLRLATTTSTQDSGLLDVLLPAFEARSGVKVEVIAVGTGQALAMGESGDVDVVLVHAPAQEKAFVAAGHGTQRYPVMHNDFILVGPLEDPAHVAGAPDAATALTLIAAAAAPFASRGDNSGTHTRELTLWKKAGLAPTPADPWYLSLGQGMGATLVFANERKAYTLTDRGTYLAQRKNLPCLTILFGGNTLAGNPDPSLRNDYSVIPVDPQKNPQIKAGLALAFVEWLTSVEAQQKIASFGIDRFGQPLFYPAAGSEPPTLAPTPATP